MNSKRSNPIYDELNFKWYGRPQMEDLFENGSHRQNQREYQRKIRYTKFIKVIQKNKRLALRQKGVNQ